MAAGSAFGSPIVHNGESYPRLTMRQYGELEGKYRDGRRQTLSSALEAEGLSAEVRAAKIAEVEAQPVTWLEIDKWLQSYDGASTAVRLSLKAAGKTDAEAESYIDQLTIVSASFIAGLVVGTLELKANPPKAASATTGAPSTPPSPDSSGSTPQS